MPLTLFNTESRRKEELVNEGRPLKIYTCGPTVYDYAHIGNFRTYIFEDLLRKTLHFFGFDLVQAMNLTDVDDKTIRGALKEHCSLEAYTKRYKEAFFEDLNKLRIEPVEHYPAATDYIPQMIELIQTLINKEMAYRGTDQSIYFPIRSFKRYGCLSHLKLDELQVGARVANDEYDKEHLADFVLWKAHDPQRDGDIFWESPFGPGRPGWHLECSCMAMSLLGESIDIHCGAVDNIFPHHENEIAQSEACTGKRFSKLWLHAEHLLVDHKKMSKSLGNFYTLRDLQSKGFSEMQLRYLLLGTHYRTQLNFTFDSLDAAKASLQRLQDFIRRLREIVTRASCPGKEVEGAARPHLEKVRQQFKEGLADDLNISVSLAALFDFVREINSLIDAGKLGIQEAEAVLALLKEFDGVLSVLDFSDEVIPPSILELAEKRQEARKSRQFAEADKLRDQVLAAGYTIEDTPKGVRIKKNG